MSKKTLEPSRRSQSPKADSSGRLQSLAQRMQRFSLLLSGYSLDGTRQHRTARSGDTTHPRLSFEDFIVQLAQAPAAGAHLEHDRDREIRYLQAHRYGFEHTLRYIPETDNQLRILDIGPTPFTLFLKQRFGHYDVAALDRTDLLGDRFRGAGVNFHTADLDQARLPFAAEQFHVVIFTEVLEHVFAPPSEVLAEIRRILVPGGLLLLSVPNIAVLANRVKLLLGRSVLSHADSQLKKEWTHGHGHIHEYTRREIVDLVRSNRFLIRRTDMLTPHFGDWARRGEPRRKLGRLLYGAALSCCPPVRPMIYLQCQKSATNRKLQANHLPSRILP